MTININKVLKVLLKKWNIIVATISIIGLLIFNFFPSINGDYYKVFIFLGINAVIWTLVEIKVMLDDKNPNKSERYLDMRQARPFILKSIYDQMKSNKDKVLNIEIVGGRIRTISDMIRELKNEIVNHDLHAKNTNIRILTLNPDFIKSWDFPKTQINDGFRQRNEGNANLIKHLREELLKYNEINEFKYNNIKIEVEYYSTYPLFYSYKIGDKFVYWGFFTWNNNDEDFVGPENPCYFLDSKNEAFQDYFSLLTNRVEFLLNCK